MSASALQSLSLTAPHARTPERTISETDPLLQIKQSGDVLTFGIQGSATTLEAEPLREVIRARMNNARDIAKVVFDLEQAMPIYNIAGRVFDIAKEVASKETGTATILKIPRHFYEEIKLSDEDLPEPANNVAWYNNLQIELVEKSSFSELKGVATAAPDMGLEIVTRCVGKIHAIEQGTVSVSLFSLKEDVGEIVGELDRRQFPDEELTVGQMFTYCGTADKTGTTQVNIQMVPRLTMHPDDLLDLYNEVRASLP